MWMILVKLVSLLLQQWSALSDSAPLDENGDVLPFMNVGTGTDLSIKDLAEAIAKSVGFEGSIFGIPPSQMELLKSC